jgi:flagellar hook-length control protein FliK
MLSSQVASREVVPGDGGSRNPAPEAGAIDEPAPTEAPRGEAADKSPADARAEVRAGSHPSPEGGDAAERASPEAVGRTAVETGPESDARSRAGSQTQTQIQGQVQRSGEAAGREVKVVAAGPAATAGTEIRSMPAGGEPGASHLAGVSNAVKGPPAIAVGVGATGEAVSQDGPQEAPLRTGEVPAVQAGTQMSHGAAQDPAGGSRLAQGDQAALLQARLARLDGQVVSAHVVEAGPTGKAGEGASVADGPGSVAGEPVADISQVPGGRAGTPSPEPAQAAGGKGSTALSTPDRGGNERAAQQLQAEALAGAAEEEAERKPGPEEVRLRAAEVVRVDGGRKTVREQGGTGEPQALQAQAGEDGPAAQAMAGGEADAGRSAPERSGPAPGGQRVEMVSRTQEETRSAHLEHAARQEPEAGNARDAGAARAAAGETAAADRAAEVALREAASAQKAGQTPARAAEVEPQRASITDQAVRAAKLTLEEGRNRFELRLNPPTLGRLGVVVELRDEALTVSFRVQNEAVRELLQNSMAQLRAALSEHGVTVGGLDVQSSGPQAGEQQAAGNHPESGRGSPGESGAGRDGSEEPLPQGTGSRPGSRTLDYWA